MLFNVLCSLDKSNLAKAEADERLLSEDRVYLEQRLNEETEKREQVERRAREEIAQLQSELNRLRRNNQVRRGEHVSIITQAKSSTIYRKPPFCSNSI